jgi:phage terminase large subunit-like protein
MSNTFGSRPGPRAQVTAEPLDLSGLPKAGGARVAAFCRTFLNVGVGKPLVLRAWQRRIVAGLFNKPRPRRGLVSLPRGNGKSTLAAALGLYGLLADGVEGAQVLCVASDQRQAEIVFNKARRMVQLEARLTDRVQVFTDRLYSPHTDSSLFPLPAEPGALHGFDPSLAIVDELWAVTDDVWEAVSTAAGKRERSLTLAISTPPRSDDSVMHRLVTDARARLDPGTYFIEYAAPPGCALDDEAAWAIANPALDDFLFADGLRSVLPPVTREPSFRRLRLGQWVEDVPEPWLPAGAWDACLDPGPIPQGSDVVLGFDGSFSGDTTALVAVSVEDIPLVEVVALWEPHNGAQVPIEDVEEAIRQACRRWRVREIVADPFRWARSLQLLDREGLPIIEFPQVPERMTPATARFYEAVVNHQLRHAGDQRLAAHIAHAVARTDSRGTRITKVNKYSTRRIDLAVAAVMAHARAAELAHLPRLQVF